MSISILASTIWRSGRGQRAEGRGQRAEVRLLFIVHCSLFSCSVVQLFSCSVQLFSCQLSVVSCSSFVVALAMGACGSQAVASLLPEKGGSKGVHPGALPTRTDSHQARARIKTHKRVHAPRTLYRRTEDEKIPRIKNQEPRTKNQEPRYRIPIPLLILESPRRPSRRRPTRPGRARVRLESWALSLEPSAWLRREEEGE